ncbi:MAG: hypothetical protein FJ147_26400 [Deltaproteobacteria bacterium]|nr:hypothetical protein [Deltaproteobacteria bacterium]
MHTEPSRPRRQASVLPLLTFWIPALRLGSGHTFARRTYPHLTAQLGTMGWTRRLCNIRGDLCLPLLTGVILCLSSPALAGHGFSSAFGNIEWLPEPGRTPDSTLYRLDAVREEGSLMLARTPTEKVRLCLSFAREKLAELEAMVKAEKTEAAAIAAERYHAYRARVIHLFSTATDEKDTLNEQIANALLEHQYILSVIYPELPVSSRPIIVQVAAAAKQHYQDIAALLPAKKKGALFFKEEEVRWSMDMATREDAAP